jgi:hypothetical protein
MESNRSTSSDADTGVRHSRARSTVPVWILLGLAFLLLISCAPPISTQGTTPQRSPTSSSISLSTPSTPQLTEQYEFTEHDSGRMVIYTVTSRFGMSFNQQKYPKKNIRLACTPAGTLGSVSNLPSVMPPLYAVRYEAVQPGLCTIKNGTFLLTVRIIA